MKEKNRLNRRIYLLVISLAALFFLISFVHAGTCGDQAGVCNSDNTGICIPDANGTITSIECYGGCSNSVCTNGDLISTYDNLGRIILDHFTDGQDDISYSYYGATKNIKMINIGNSKEIYGYDLSGRILFEHYPGHREKDTNYYYNGNSQTIIKNGLFETNVYDDQDRVTRIMSGSVYEQVFSVIDYQYDEQDRIRLLTTPDKSYEYHYFDSPPIWQDKFDYIVISSNDLVTNAVQTSTLYFNYDANGNLISKRDSSGAIVSYTNENINYPCFDSSTCSYTRIKSRAVNNFNVQANYDASGEVPALPISYDQLDQESNIIQTFTPIKNYNPSGHLTEDDIYTYVWDGNQLVSRINKDTDITTIFTYNTENQIIHLAYSDGGSEDWAWSPSGSLIYKKYTTPTGISSISQLNGAVIKNFFINIFATITGNAITGKVTEGATENPDGSVTYSYIYSEPGGVTSALPEADYSLLLERYENETGPIEIPVPPACYDEDRLNSNYTFGDSLFNSSYVIFNDEYYFDSCRDNETVIENYCGRSIPIFGSIIQKTRAERCNYGCINGACIYSNETSGIIENCSDGIQNQNETGIDCGGVCDACAPRNNDGLVAYYPFDGNAHDASGNGNDGITSDVNITIGVLNNAYLFDNQDSRVDVNKSILSSVFSLSMYLKDSYPGLDWVYADEAMSILILEPTHVVSIPIYTTNMGFQFKSLTNADLFDGNWHSFILTKDESGNFSVYIDGIFNNIDLPSGMIFVDANRSVIGHCIYCSGGGAYGEANKAIDEVRVYNRTLTQIEIQKLAKTAIDFNLPPEPSEPEIV